MLTILRKMILRKIKVENIRSYLNQEINLPEGSVLLAGDIGSGKSSLLLAIEFALFGLQKGELAGSALLRNGKYNGSVELHVNIDNREIIIHRALKRTKTGINQDECYIIAEGIKKQLTPIETRQIVLNLLNYPKEALTKNPIIYRYTVYTPQEQMKQILLDDNETRINSIRKIFNLDKYGRIKDNSKIIIDKLKERVNAMSGAIIDLEIIIQREKEKVAYKEEIYKRIKELDSPLSETKTEINKLKEKIILTEKEISLLNNLKREYAVLETELKNVVQKKEYNLKKLTEIKSKIKQLPEFKAGEKEQEESSLNLIETELKDITKNLNELNIHIKKSREVIQKISNLDICPLCEQKVHKEHIENITKRENELISKINVEIESFAKKETEYVIKLTRLKNKIEILRKNENEFLIIKSETRLNEEIQKIIEQEQELLEKNLNELKEKKIKLNNDILRFKNIEPDYNNLKEYCNKLLQREKELEINKAYLSSEFTALEKELISLKEEINKKREIKENMDNCIKLRTWFADDFITIVETIEKNVMVKINYDFNNIFQKWFNTMVDDENITIKIDETFSPLIIQNNHDINYEYLSGGEKTAVALSYRLALNQTINSILSSLNTKDIIILDEPTDGFSSEQLDRVRLVLNELNAKQIILVSHESKIESFVDNVIRFNKKEHISSIN